MKDFIFSYPTKAYFAQDALTKAAAEQQDKSGANAMPSYGGGA